MRIKGCVIYRSPRSYVGQFVIYRLSRAFVIYRPRSPSASHFVSERRCSLSQLVRTSALARHFKVVRSPAHCFHIHLFRTPSYTVCVIRGCESFLGPQEYASCRGRKECGSNGCASNRATETLATASTIDPFGRPTISDRHPRRWTPYAGRPNMTDPFDTRSRPREGQVEECHI